MELLHNCLVWSSLLAGWEYLQAAAPSEAPPPPSSSLLPLFSGVSAGIKVWRLPFSAPSCFPSPLSHRCYPHQCLALWMLSWRTHWHPWLDLPPNCSWKNYLKGANYCLGHGLAMRSCCVALGTVSSPLWWSRIMWEKRMCTCMCNWVTLLYSRKKNCYWGNNNKKIKINFKEKEKGINWLFCLVFCFCFFRATLAAYVSSQARDQTAATAASPHHSHARSKPHLWSTPKLMVMATPDP